MKQYVCRKCFDDFHFSFDFYIKAIWSIVYIKRGNLFPAQKGLKHLEVEFFWPSDCDSHCLILR